MSLIENIKIKKNLKFIYWQTLELKKPQIKRKLTYDKSSNFLKMNIFLFWILFLALWAIVPLMIFKGRTDETPKLKTSPEVKAKKKGWFN